MNELYTDGQKEWKGIGKLDWRKTETNVKKRSKELEGEKENRLEKLRDGRGNDTKKLKMDCYTVIIVKTS
jgi:hypothetical protein